MAAEGGSERPGKGAGQPARGRPRSRGQGARGRAARLRIGAAPAVGPRCRKGWPCAFGLMVPRWPKRCPGGGPGSRSTHPPHRPEGGESPCHQQGSCPLSAGWSLWPCRLLLSVCPLGYPPRAHLARLPALLRPPVSCPQPALGPSPGGGLRHPGPCLGTARWHVWLGWALSSGLWSKMDAAGRAHGSGHSGPGGEPRGATRRPGPRQGAGWAVGRGGSGEHSVTAFP